MADNVDDHRVQRIEKRSYGGRNREQRTVPRTKDKVEESQLPVPPPDPWANPWCSQNARNQAEITQTRSLEEDEDIIAYLTDFGTPTIESQTSECPSRNSAISTMAISNLCMDDAFEHLDRLYAFTEQILELRSRSSKFFKRVRNLEKMKVLRNVDRRLENAFARDKDTMNDICDEDTGFAESLLDAMLSNCRESPFQRRNTRSSSSRQARSKSDVEKQTLADEISGNGPKVSKWTRVKAAFKWERACTNDAGETMDTTISATPTTPALSSPTIKYHRSLDTEMGDSNNTPVLSCANEASDAGTPFGRTSSASSSNEGSYDYFQKNISNHLGCQSSKIKIDKKVECANQRSQSLDDEIVTSLNTEGDNNLINMGKPLIRVTSEKNHTTHSLYGMDERETDLSFKRFTPTLTITIPSNEEEMRCISSPDSSSPLPSSAHTSGGNSPQPRKMHREFSINKDFKRQQSANEGFTALTSKSQRQNSKWNKVRRAFLTNSTLSVPPNLIRIVSRQMILQDGLDASLAYGYSNSSDDLRKTPLNAQAETRRDYHALREKLGAEFHRKLVEWERLKNLSPRVATKDSREIPSNSLSPRETLLSEERLAPEFRKKLQDWKRTKKERRGSAPFEHQRLNRRRLTDWQLWRSASKSEYRSKEIAGSRGSCDESVADGRSHLGDDFVRKMEVRRRTNDPGNRDAKQPTESKSNRLGISSGIDETEFLALERVVPLLDNGFGKGRRDSDARRLDECFDGDVRPFADGTQNLIDTNEVLIRTSVGSYRFEGISREFTRKLYDWERYRGISPTSSTFRLLGPAYDPFTRNTTVGTSAVTPPATKAGNDEPSLFKVNALKRSKSAGSVVEEMVQDEFFVRRSTSLQTLSHCAKLKDSKRIDILPLSVDSHRTEAEDIVMDDSEPEAMIVDIEDVIEETASPLERVQPHQTPVYSVAASETTSIAVPLGTVTSSHEPSPVFLIEIEENDDRKHWESKKWNRRNSFSSVDSSSTEHSETTKAWNDKDVSKDENINSDRSFVIEASIEKKQFTEGERFRRDLDKDSIKSDSSIHSMELDQKCTIAKRSERMDEQSYTDRERDEISEVQSATDNVNGSTEKYGLDGTDENRTSYERNFTASLKETMDLSSDKNHEREDDTHGAENDRSSDNGEAVTVAQMKCDHEYEEIEINSIAPRCCSSADRQPNYGEERAKTLSDSSANYKLDESKFPLSEMGLRRVNPDDERFNNHERNYGVIREEIHNHHKCQNQSKIQSNPQNYESFKSYNENSDHGQRRIAVGTESTQTRERQYHNFENVLSSLMLRSGNPCDGDYHCESTIKTTSCTVTPCREERCFERIIINEETLNKIVVPTASTGCTDNSKASEQPTEASDVETSGEASINQEGNAKKRVSGSPGRNVFIKTKRIIFSPFRRVEEHSAGRRESLEDDRAFSTKGKCKSRSASPKVNRQMRMSLSLPWPLRSSSKDRELKETRIKKEDKEQKVEESIRKSSETSISKGVNSSIELMEQSNGSKQSLEGKNQRVSVSVQATPDQQQARAIDAIGSSSLRSDSCSLKFNPHSSDLIHKLRILSNAVARRDGRTNTISEESSVESHSLRIRRAKEDFLSRRGGPLCRSVLEPRLFKDHEFPKRSVHRYEEIPENRTKDSEKLSETSRSSTLEASSKRGTEEETITGGKMEFFRNDYDTKKLTDNSVVSRPDRVKSASVGMINVDPDTFVRLTETNRGCESLPRSIVKQQEPLGPLAKIVNKLKFTKLMRSKDMEEGNMSTISKLCRQSLLIDVRNDGQKSWEDNDRRGVSADDINQIKKEE